MSLRDIEKAVYRFRGAMEKCHVQLGLPFENFPRGCCGDASELLAAYLKDEGFGDFAYVSGWCTKEKISHAWLEQCGIFFDVTTDQFADRNISEMITDDGDWHSRFAEHFERREDGDFRHDEGAVHLHGPYAQLKRLIAIES